MTDAARDSAVGPALPDGYGQLCSLAMALDVVGPRWNLLILRDLARTPLRFTDLQAINPGLSPTMLTRRLRDLESTGVIEKRPLPRPATGSVYAIVESIRPPVVAVLSAIADLGAYVLEADPPTDDPVELLAAQMELNGHFVMARGADLEGYFLLDLMGWQTHVVVEADSFSATTDAPTDRTPDATAVFFPPTTLMRIMGRVISLGDAEADGLVTIAGNRDAMTELIALLSFAEPAV